MYMDRPDSGLNVDLALEHVGGDRELLSELASIFVRDYPQLIEQADEGIRQENYSLLERTAHTLKGRMAFFGISRLRDRLTELEEMGQEQDLSRAASMLLSIKTEMKTILPAIELLIRVES
jgi:HPt (histidine-containing phosphotransfer) domain-containing protein